MNAPVLGRDVGKAFKQFESVLSRVERYIFDRVELDTRELGHHLSAHPRLTYVIAHGGAVSWLPITVALIKGLAQCAPERLGTGTFHKGLWKIPGVSAVTKFFSGAERHLTFTELSAALATGDCDFFAFPESDSSLYGDLVEIKPFRFHRFIELSVGARMPMLLVAHRGSEEWYRSLPMLNGIARLLPPALFSFVHLDKQQFLSQTELKGLNLPVPMGKISLKVRTELFWPAAYEQGFPADPGAKKAHLVEEGERIRARLQALSDSI